MEPPVVEPYPTLWVGTYSTYTAYKQTLCFLAGSLNNGYLPVVSIVISTYYKLHRYICTLMIEESQIDSTTFDPMQPAEPGVHRDMRRFHMPNVNQEQP